MILRAPSGGSPTTPTALAVLFALILGGGSAHAASVTIAWDRSPDPNVIGYRVYVGTTTGLYTQNFDVGNVTSFSYNATEQRTYYFAVASYAPGPVVGALSGEVSTAGGAAPSDPSQTSVPATNYWSWLWGLQISAKRLSQAPICWMPSATDCVTVQIVARSSALVSSLAVAPDGRLFFLEGGRQVRVLTSAGLVDAPVYTEPNPAITLNHVVVDPDFLASGLIWIGETESSNDGRREFRVVRYRVVQNQAGERAVVSAVPVPGSGNAVFTLDASRHIYIAVPASAQGPRDVYEGTVVRFDATGSLPADNRNGSPILATGYPQPVAMVVDSATGTLWISGSDGQMSSMAAINVRAQQATAPVLTPGARQDLTVTRDGSGTHLVSVTGDGLLERLNLLSPELLSSRATLRRSSAAQLPLAVAAGVQGEVYVAIQSATTNGATTFAIQRIIAIP